MPNWWKCIAYLPAAIMWLTWYMPFVLHKNRLQTVGCAIDSVACGYEHLGDWYIVNVVAIWNTTHGQMYFEVDQYVSDAITCDDTGYKNKYLNVSICYVDRDLILDRSSIDRNASVRSIPFGICVVATLLAILLTVLYDA